MFWIGPLQKWFSARKTLNSWKGGWQNSQLCQKELKITLTICDNVCLTTNVFPNLSLWVVGVGVFIGRPVNYKRIDRN